MQPLGLTIDSKVFMHSMGMVLEAYVCVYLRDNAEAEFKAFQSVFPESTHLLCQIHLLQGAVH